MLLPPLQVCSFSYGGVTVHLREGALGDGLGAKVWSVCHIMCRCVLPHHVRPGQLQLQALHNPTRVQQSARPAADSCAACLPACLPVGVLTGCRRALARELVRHPEIFRDQVVLELGSGTGLVGIVAALAGARQVRRAVVVSAWL